VVQSYSLGPHLRTDDLDPGLSLGPSRSTKVYAANSEVELAPGWAVAWRPKIEAAPVTTRTETAGLQLRAAPDWGLTLGYDVKTVMARVDSDAAVNRWIKFDSRTAEKAFYRDCDQPGGCGE
jgi:hypothetical protein